MCDDGRVCGGGGRGKLRSGDSVVREGREEGWERGRGGVGGGRGRKREGGRARKRGHRKREGGGGGGGRVCWTAQCWTAQRRSLIHIGRCGRSPLFKLRWCPHH